jgi:dephospho-CoA kinase
LSSPAARLTSDFTSFHDQQYPSKTGRIEDGDPLIPTIGIVGGIGSGKSVVARAMQSLGGYLIEADQLGHAALEQPHIQAQIVKRWGNSVLSDQGKADRKQIGRIVFGNAEELRALESYVFPYIEKRIHEEIALARSRSDVQFIILDAAILLETGWKRHCDKIVFVDTPRATRLQRLKDNRGWDEAEVERREKMQMPLDEKKLHADAILVNDGEAEKVIRQVQDTLVSWKVIC